MKENNIHKMIRRNVDRQLVREYLLKETERAGYGGLTFNRPQRDQGYPSSGTGRKGHRQERKGDPRPAAQTPRGLRPRQPTARSGGDRGIQNQCTGDGKQTSQLSREGLVLQKSRAQHSPEHHGRGCKGMHRNPKREDYRCQTPVEKFQKGTSSTAARQPYSSWT